MPPAPRSTRRLCAAREPAAAFTATPTTRRARPHRIDRPTLFGQREQIRAVLTANVNRHCRRTQARAMPADSVRPGTRRHSRNAQAPCVQDANMAPASPPARAEPPVSLNADMSEHTTQAVPEQVTGTPTMVGVPVHGKGQDVHRAFSYQYSVASAWWQQWYQWYARNYTGAPFEPLGAVPPAAMQHGAAVAGARPPAQPPLRVATSASADGGAVDQERPRGPAAWQEGAAAGAPASTATGSAAGTVAGVPRPAVADKSKVRTHAAHFPAPCLGCQLGARRSGRCHAHIGNASCFSRQARGAGVQELRHGLHALLAQGPGRPAAAVQRVRPLRQEERLHAAAQPLEGGQAAARRHGVCNRRGSGAGGARRPCGGAAARRDGAGSRNQRGARDHGQRAAGHGTAVARAASDAAARARHAAPVLPCGAPPRALCRRAPAGLVLRGPDAACAQSGAATRCAAGGAAAALRERPRRDTSAAQTQRAARA